MKSSETVIEIGSGHGEITFAVIKKLSNLVVKNFKIIAIEQNKKLVENLEFRIKNLGIKNIKIIQGDALKILPKLITQLPNYPITNYKLIGNIPFYITGYLFRILAELKNKPSLVLFFIQKEVAERIIAEPPKMNLLAASVQFWAEPKIVGYISRKEFKPMPKVDSAIIKLETKDKRQETRNAEKYYKFIKILFKQPRKTILNNLKPLAATELISQKLKLSGVSSRARPQNLNIEQLQQLSTLF